MVTLSLVPDVLVPLAVGILIPFLTAWISARNWSPIVESLLNIALSAAASALITVQWDGDWHNYLIAFAAAWIASGRSYQTKIPSGLYYSDRVTLGKHQKQDQLD